MIAFLSALTMMQSNFEFDFQEINKRNDKRFNNRGYSFFFLNEHFLSEASAIGSKYIKMTGLQDLF